MVYGVSLAVPCVSHQQQRSHRAVAMACDHNEAFDRAMGTLAQYAAHANEAFDSALGSLAAHQDPNASRVRSQLLLLARHFDFTLLRVWPRLCACLWSDPHAAQISLDVASKPCHLSLNYVALVTRVPNGSGKHAVIMLSG